jgi:hypothetical protein
MPIKIEGLSITVARCGWTGAMLGLVGGFVMTVGVAPMSAICRMEKVGYAVDYITLLQHYLHQ